MGAHLNANEGLRYCQDRVRTHAHFPQYHFLVAVTKQIEIIFQQIWDVMCLTLVCELSPVACCGYLELLIICFPLVFSISYR